MDKASIIDNEDDEEVDIRNETFIVEEDDKLDSKNLTLCRPIIRESDSGEHGLADIPGQEEDITITTRKWEPVWSIPLLSKAEYGSYDHRWYRRLKKKALANKFGIVKLAWSNNSLKLAVATSENVIYLYDDSGSRRDKFALKPVDPKYGRKSFVVTGLAFQTDGAKLAVAQTDGVIFVYNIGFNWHEKKSICNKFIQASPVTCLLWLFEGPLIFGLINGQVRTSNVNSNKTKTLYNTESCVVSLAANAKGTGFLSGHMDGTVIRCYIKFDPKPEEKGLALRLRYPPYTLTWANGYIMTAGIDASVLIFKHTGDLHKVYDYTEDGSVATFFESCISPTGQCVVFGCYDGLRCYSWKPRKRQWEEDTVKKIPGLRDITCLAWKQDGSRLSVGTSSGVCDIYEPALRRMVYKKKIEITYMGPNYVKITSLIPGMRGVTFTSMTDKEIEEVRVMGDYDQYVVARTSKTLILVNLEKELVSELRWPPSHPDERFIFRHPSVCLVYRPGELTIVEYGKNEVLMSLHSEIVTPALVSLRINERRPNNKMDYKRLGYMLDNYTVCIINLAICKTVVAHRHHTQVDWLDLNETGGKLLFRDRRRSLYVLDADYNTCNHLVNHCTFAEWLEGTNAVIAQSRSTLFIFYNINVVKERKTWNITGTVVEVIREMNRLIVVTEDSPKHKLYFDLEVSRLDFETAIGDKQLEEAYKILKLQSGFTPEMRYLLRVLGQTAFKLFDFDLALECFGRLRDLPHIRFIQEHLALAEERGYPKETEFLTSEPLFEIRAAIFEKDLDTALKICINKCDVEDAVDLCTQYGLWDEAYNLASGMGSIKAEEFREKYISYLVTKKRYHRAAEIKERHGELNSAFFYYFRGGSFARAASIMMSKSNLLNDKELTEMFLGVLKKTENYLIAGEVYEQLNEMEAAYEMYCAGNDFSKAIELARRLYPHEIVHLEEKWGDLLMRCCHQEEAINHYIEAGKLFKALSAAMHSQQLKKAAEIIKNMEDVSTVIPDVRKTAQFHAAFKEYDIAEELFAKAELWKDALDMYENAGEWTRIRSMADKHRSNKQLIDLYNTRAIIHSQEGNLLEAEILFVSIGEPDSAISMYKDNRRYKDMLRMVSTYHPDLLRTTHYHLGQEFESDARYEQARYHYLEIDDFNSVIKMYQKAGKWENAYLAAKTYASPRVVDHVAYLWARELHGTGAVKLLTKLNALESSIEFACADYQFEFALYVASMAVKDKLSDVHYKYAMALEDEGKFEEAEEHFLKANKPKEAVLMYMHTQDYNSALRLTERYMPDSVKDLLETQARVVFEKQRYNFFERLLLRAGRPDLIVKTYKEAGMWGDAMRVGSAYLPYTDMEELRDEYDKAVAENAANKPAVDKIMKKAEDLEKKKEYEKAIDCYLKVDECVTTDLKFLMMAWKTAAEISIMHLDKDKIKLVAKVLGPKLKKINKHKLAVKMYSAAGMPKEAIDTYISVGDWKRAKQLAEETDSSYVTYVANVYTEMLKHGGLANLIERREKEKEVKAIIDELIQENDWEKVLVLVEEYELTDVLPQYVGRYAMCFIKKNSPHEALDLLLKYNAPAGESMLYVYKKVIYGLMYAIRWATHGAYREWASMRTLLLRLIQNMRSPGADFADVTIHHFETLLLIIHYITAREAYRLDSSLQLLTAKISSALVRYIQVIPIDRAFFEAGMDNRLIGNEQEAFLYLNHFLDFCEAIKEKSWKNFDDGYLEYTDLPTELPLPRNLFIEGGFMYEEVKDWIISQSVENRPFDFFGLLDDRKLLPHALKPRREDVEEEDEGDEIVKEEIPGREPCPPCIISGYPILQHHGEKPLKFERQGVFAIPEEWQRVHDAAKENPTGPVNDVLAFIAEWWGKPSKVP